MRNISLDDTIAAISTGLGESGIGIVRVSGKLALSVADQIFLSKDGKKPSEFKTYTMHYGWIVDEKTKIIDEVILTVMRAPKSFTKEDVIEINCHGGIIALRGVLDLVLENGCCLALPGEFTKRAFLNGRIDLAQAEAVLDIIKAKTDSALKVGQEQLKGSLSKQINEIRNNLLDILSSLEAGIDFPEEDIEPADLKKLSEKLKSANNKLIAILNSAKTGKVLREGLSTVICGKPNVGKSSLLNALLKQERSIVTAIPGTTRDAIEEIIDIRGIPVRIVDTAGILEPRDLIEKKAVARSKKYIDSADLVILLFDNNKKLAKQDRLLIKKLEKKTTIAVINKVDLKEEIEKNIILKKFKHVVGVSAKKRLNIDILEEEIANLVYGGKIQSPESILITNLRHIESVRQAQKLIAEAIDSVNNKLSLEFPSQNIKDGLGVLDRLLGKSFSEDLLDKIFSEFCIGK